jgi:hypothetical protein
MAPLSLASAQLMMILRIALKDILLVAIIFKIAEIRSEMRSHHVV